MKEPLELRRRRDFGQIINDSVTFLRENFKQLFIPLLVICGFFIVIGTITSVFQYMGMMNIYSGLLSANSNSYEIPSYTVTYFVSVIFNVIILVLLQTCVHLVTLCYISVYLQKGGIKPTFEEVWGYFRYYFFRVIGSGFLVVILTIFAALLCFFPGIYLGNVLSLVIPIIVIENSSFGYAFNKSFRLIKDNWWFVFGVVFITSLIVTVISSFASIPLTVLTLAGKFFSQKSFTLPLIILFSALKNILTLAYTLPVIALALCYFNLSEQKEGLGLLDRIEKFGTGTDDNPNMPAEEY